MGWLKMGPSPLNAQADILTSLCLSVFVMLMLGFNIFTVANFHSIDSMNVLKLPCTYIIDNNIL